MDIAEAFTPAAYTVQWERAMWPDVHPFGPLRLRHVVRVRMPSEEVAARHVFRLGPTQGVALGDYVLESWETGGELPPGMASAVAVMIGAVIPLQVPANWP